jgi:3-deoxy-D-manno-octulosonic-acid transferase
MHTFWFIVYNFLIVPLLWVFAKLSGLVDKRTRQWFRGRKNLFDRLRLELKLDGSSRDPSRTQSVPKDDIKRIWFHAASVGEFEQAKPIIELLKQRSSGIEVIASFFSTSGYEHTRGYRPANHITYLPLDGYWNAKRFIEILHPSAAVFMRYDMWPNHIWRLAKERIPSFLVDATAGKPSRRKNWVVRSFLRECYNAVDYVLAVSPADVEGFKEYSAKHPFVKVAGDTRYDRVYTKSKEAIKSRMLPEHILRAKKVFIVGSSWDSDEEHIFPVFCKLQQIEPELLMVLVPHEPNEQNLERIETELVPKTTTIRFSGLNNYNGERVIIIDCVGILLSLYVHGHIAYVGGSFRPGVHNVLEPATYGIPVLFGPKIDNSQEAQELVKRGGGIVVRNKRELYRKLRELLGDETKRRKAGEAATKLVEDNIGATERITSYIEKVL